MPKDTKAVPSAAAPQALAGGRCCMELSCAAPAALPSGFLNISPLAFYNSCDGGSQSFLALGKLDELRVESAAAFPLLREYVSESADWVFGVLSYELKNEL
ncbi:MAG: hypothetical protein ACE5DN_04805, partial [Flavobacteriales bacterium]